ncbi:putative hydrolase subunit [Cupriavidus necator]|uniref:Putative hydrolase subunit n=1 Tax=Cupriavidus necator TaxID=106590 RepID=A0A1K0J871_CUPNE|nr:putative hydrolase subunit [Cupriavidus necator]
MIEVLSTGAPNVVQDLGRPGHLGIGVGRSGAMDAMALSLANALVGNEDVAAGIEISLFPFRVRFQCETVFACTGSDSRLLLDGNLLAPWWGRRVKAGEVLVVERPRRGARAYLAFAGGIDVPTVLGSRSTDLKCGFGGWEGRGLRRGDVLPLGKAPAALLRGSGLGLIPGDLPAFWRDLSQGCIAVRAVPAAEYEWFSAEARAAFTTTPYKVTPDANRQGYRLAGEALALTRPLELLSHGIVPGTIQVPPSGQPIIQLAEANTCGGYPKIATVIEADLWRLAQAPAGCELRFVPVDQDQAIAVSQAQGLERSLLRSSIALMAGRS